MGARFQVPLSEKAQSSMHNCWVLQCIPTPGLPGTLNQKGIHVLGLLPFHVPVIDQDSVLMTAIETVFPAQEDWSTRQQGPLSLISSDSDL